VSLRAVIRTTGGVGLAARTPSRSGRRHPEGKRPLIADEAHRDAEAS
jgi:hypothetical protein